MSLPTFTSQEEGPDREDAINQIIASIAMEELGLSHVINAEGEKLQYALGTLEGVSGPEVPPTMDDLFELNKSVQKTLDSTMMNQFFLREKLQSALCASIMEGPTGATGATGPVSPFLSSYVEATGETQTVAVNGLIEFNPTTMDNVGNNIVLDDTGTIFTINQPGLYHVEWNINVAQGVTLTIVGILENDEDASGAGLTGTGCLSSGTLINVETTPFTLSLRNYATSLNIENIASSEGTAVSIRILRFADGPSA